MGGQLARWLRRELDADGVPVRIAVPDWHRCLAILGEARRQARRWPSGCDQAISGLVLATLRFARPDGSPAMHPDAGAAGRTPPVWAGRGLDPLVSGHGHREGPGLVVRLQIEGDRARASSLAGLVRDGSGAALCSARTGCRAATSWPSTTAIPGSPCRFELFGQGRSWLGPGWGEVLGGSGEPASRPRPSRWVTVGEADLIEWSYRVDRVLVTRSALMLRGRRLALLSVLAERRESTWDAEPELRLTMPARIAAGPIKSSRALVLTEPGAAGRRRPCRSPCPVAPTSPSADRSGPRMGRSSSVRRRTAGDAGSPCSSPGTPNGTARTLDWRVLTVSERSRPVPPDRAFAARVSWGREETYVIYRSLGPPARRAFLGHQTAARFLVAEFSEDGELKPILTVE